jgi:hypothetical protein
LPKPSGRIRRGIKLGGNAVVRRAKKGAGGVRASANSAMRLNVGHLVTQYSLDPRLRSNFFPRIPEKVWASDVEPLMVLYREELKKTPRSRTFTPAQEGVRTRIENTILALLGE